MTSGESLAIGRRQPIARGHVGLGRNSLNLGSLGYHIRDLSTTSFVNGRVIAVFNLDNRQTIRCTFSGFCHAAGTFVVISLGAVP